jgi:hypothetical protein
MEALKGCERLRLSHFQTFGSQKVARLSALQAGRFSPPGRFVVLIYVRGWVDTRAIVQLEGLGKLKKFSSSGTRTGDLPACSIVTQRTTLLRALLWTCMLHNLYIYFFPLLLYCPILDLGRLLETFRFISVSRSRTVGRTPWTGGQLVARPLLTAPGDCDDEVREMNGYGRGNRSTRRNPALPLCPPQIPLTRPGREPRPPRWEASD